MGSIKKKRRKKMSKHKYDKRMKAQRRVLLKCNAPKSSLDRVVKAMPALHAPTVNALHGGDWFAVESVVEERKVRDLIPALKSAGATGIIELPLNKIIF